MATPDFQKFEPSPSSSLVDAEPAFRIPRRYDMWQAERLGKISLEFFGSSCRVCSVRVLQEGFTHLPNFLEPEEATSLRTCFKIIFVYLRRKFNSIFFLLPYITPEIKPLKSHRFCRSCFRSFLVCHRTASKSHTEPEKSLEGSSRVKLSQTEWSLSASTCEVQALKDAAAAGPKDETLSTGRPLAATPGVPLKHPASKNQRLSKHWNMMEASYLQKSPFNIFEPHSQWA